MRLSYVVAAFCLWAGPAFACNITIGDYPFEKGSVVSSSVVDATSAQAVLTSDTGEKLHAMATASSEPVAMRIGSKMLTAPLAGMLSERGPMFFKDKVFTVPAESNSEALVLQQEMKRCL